MFWRKKSSFCATCPLREPPCLAGKCKIKQCHICYWCKDIGKLKAFFSTTNRLQCSVPALADPVTGKPKDTCDSARSYDSKCGKAGKYFLHKEFVPLNDE